MRDISYSDKTDPIFAVKKIRGSAAPKFIFHSCYWGSKILQIIAYDVQRLGKLIIY